MAMPSARFFDGRKFMQDGKVYAARQEAEGARDRYQADRFEVRLVEQDGAFLVYTRRVVTDIKVEGAPPA
jgi:hypothetical protein